MSKFLDNTFQNSKPMIPKIQNHILHLQRVDEFCQEHEPFFSALAPEVWDYTNEPLSDGRLYLFFFAHSWHGGPKVTEAVGARFGKDNWTAEPDSNTFNWTKELPGCRLKIYGAAERPVEGPRPVFAHEWPVLLEDSEGKV